MSLLHDYDSPTYNDVTVEDCIFTDCIQERTSNVGIEFEKNLIINRTNNDIDLQIGNDLHPEYPTNNATMSMIARKDVNFSMFADTNSAGANDNPEMYFLRDQQKYGFTWHMNPITDDVCMCQIKQTGAPNTPSIQFKVNGTYAPITPPTLPNYSGQITLMELKSSDNSVRLPRKNILGKVTTVWTGIADNEIRPITSGSATLDFGSDDDNNPTIYIQSDAGSVSRIYFNGYPASGAIYGGPRGVTAGTHYFEQTNSNGLRLLSGYSANNAVVTPTEVWNVGTSTNPAHFTISAPTFYITNVAQDDTQTKVMVWDSGNSGKVEYRDINTIAVSGTWAAVLSGWTGPWNLPMTLRMAVYQRIGNQVMCQLKLDLGSFDNASGGLSFRCDLPIAGTPWASATNRVTGVTCWYGDQAGLYEKQGVVEADFGADNHVFVYPGFWSGGAQANDDNLCVNFTYTLS